MVKRRFLQLGITEETQIDVDKNMCKTDDKNRRKNEFMSSQTFHLTYCGRVQKTIV
jgi:hypothetical protein